MAMSMLSAKIAFVSAAASGIGLAIARALLSAGAQVIICDVDAEALRLAQVENPQLRGYVCDVGCADSVAAMFAEIGKNYSLDILVNNAGIAGSTASVENITTEAWSECLRVGLDSHFYCTREVVSGMRSRASGVIVNITSTAGLHGFPNRSAYAAAKWAVCGLTKTWAMELGEYNIRVNAIAPGSVRGERIERVINAHAKLEGRAVEDIAREYCLGVSMGQFVEAQEIADLVLFLCSPQARHISGQIIAVDGNTETLHVRT